MSGERRDSTAMSAGTSGAAASSTSTSAMVESADASARAGLRRERNSPTSRWIDERPAAIESRLEVWHREGDTVVGARGERTCLLTMVEHTTAWAEVVRLPHRTVRVVNRATLALTRQSGLPFKTLTWEKGTEFHGYRAWEQSTGVRCYLACPHRPWKRGSSENFNGLLRL